MPSPSASPTSNAIDRTRTPGSSSSRFTTKSIRRSATCCGRNPMSRINRVAAVAAMLIAAATLHAQEYNETVTKKMTFHGGRGSIENPLGKNENRTHSGHLVDVEATIRASGAEIGRSINRATTDK